MAQNNAVDAPVEGAPSLGGMASLEGLEDYIFGGADTRDPPALAQLLASPRDETTTITGHLDSMASGGPRGFGRRISLQEACQSTLYGAGV